jgi:hypothetical protein
MNNFNFGEVLTRAWQIIWKHKVLWIFGILASCGRGGSSGNSGNSGGSGDNGFDGSNLPPQVTQWLQWIENNLTTFIAITIALVCVIWIVVTFLSTIGKIGLIRGTAQVEGGAESLVFGQLFSESTPYFWRIFGLSLILSIPAVIVVAALFAALIVFAASASGGSDAAGIGMVAMLPLLIGCICLLVPVMFVLGMIFRQAERAIVLEDMGVMPAVSRGWEIFRGNLGPIILMAIILAIIGFVIGLVIAIPILIIVFPAMLAFIAGGADNNTPLIFMGICFCLYLPVLILLNGIMVAYVESAWTLTYMRLTRKPEGGAPVITPPEINDPVLPEDSEKTIIARPNA